MFPARTIAAIATAAALTATTIASANATEARYHYGYGDYGSKARIAIIDNRIARQHRRIRVGRRSGRLNWVESRRLRFELSHIHGFRARYVRDGFMSVSEKHHLHRLLNDNSRRLRRFASTGHGSWQGWRYRNRDRVGYYNPFRNRDARRHRDAWSKDRYQRRGRYDQRGDYDRKRIYGKRDTHVQHRTYGARTRQLSHLNGFK